MPTSAAFALSFGSLLRQLRKRAGMTQSDLAAALGYSTSFVSALEKDQRLPDLDMVVQRYLPALCLQGSPHLADQLVAAAAHARGESLPPTRTVQHRRHVATEDDSTGEHCHLPIAPTQLIGREPEVELLGKRLLGHYGRLLTLVGPPGIGKTRLALAVAERVQPHFDDGVCFVGLAAVDTAESMAAAMAAAVLSAAGRRETDARPPQAQLIEFLRRKTLLLLLDNLEQIGGAAPLVAAVLAECPGVAVLATSRERLHLRAEQRYKVPPLAPAAAVELFVQRAQAVDFAFAPPAAQQPLLETICQRLDCLPLAIELIAARVDLFSPEALLARLEDCALDLSNDGPDDTPEHQRTLRDAIYRSYRLLDEPQAALFRTLGIFAGGFDLAAVTHFGFDEASLQALIHKSLVKPEVQAGGHTAAKQRFFLLEVLRQYAREQLILRNKLADVQQRHAQYFLAVAEDAWVRLHNREPGTWQAYLERDQDNLRAALRYSLDTNPEVALRLASILGEYWYFQGQLGEGQTWLRQALAQSAGIPSGKPTGVPLRLRIKALREAGRIALAQGEYAESARLLAEGLDLARQHGDKRELAISLVFGGGAALYQLDLAGAEPLFAESLSLAQELGDQNRIAIALDHLGQVAMVQGEHVKAQAHFAESLAIQRALGGDVTVESVLFNLGYNELQVGHPRQAFAYLQQAIALSLKKGQKEETLACLEALAALAGLYGAGPERKVQAIRLFGAAAALRDALGIARPPIHRSTYAWTMAVLHSQVDDAAFAAAWAEGRALTLEEAAVDAIAQ